MCIVAVLTTLHALAVQYRLCRSLGRRCQWAVPEKASRCSTGWPCRHHPSPGRPPGTLPSRLPARNWGCASLKTGVAQALALPQGSAAAPQLCLPPHLRMPQHARAGMLQAAVPLHRHLKAAERGRQPVLYLQAKEHRLRFRQRNSWAIRHLGVPICDKHAHSTKLWQCIIPSPEQHRQGSLNLRRAAKPGAVCQDWHGHMRDPPELRGPLTRLGGSRWGAACCPACRC